MWIISTFSSSNHLGQFRLSISCLLILMLSAYTNAGELEEVTKLLDSKQTTSALNEINKLLIKEPQNAEAMFLRGVILVEAGKKDDAISTFTKMTESFPNLAEPYNNLAVLYAESGQFDQAKKALETAIRKQPSYAAAHENLGDIYSQMALDSYHQSSQLDAKNKRVISKITMLNEHFVNGSTSRVNMKEDKSNKDENKLLDTESRSVIESIDLWAKAWANKDVDRYLASYADSFKPPTGETRKDWIASRRERLAKPTNISSEVINYKIIVESKNKAKANFMQVYSADGKPMFRSDGNPIISNKMLSLIKVNGRWLIEHEVGTN